MRCPNASVRPGRALARAYPTAKLATLLLMLASSPQVEQLGLAIRFDCSDIGGDKGMVVGRRMRNEQPEAVARVRVGHETSSIETVRLCARPQYRIPLSGCEHRALDGFPRPMPGTLQSNLTFGYTSRAVGSFHVALCVAMLPGEGVLGFPAHTRLLRHLSAS